MECLPRQACTEVLEREREIVERVTLCRNVKTHFPREIREVLLREREGEGITLFRNRKIHCPEREEGKD